MKKIKAAILSAGLMLFISVLLLAILSFIFAKTSSLPKASLTVLTTVAASIAVFLGSLFSTLYLREKGILFGILSGLLFALCAGLVSFLVFQNDFTAAGAGKAAAVLISGALGGVLGVNRESKVKF